jgi:4-alpha-glucanotransferase
VPPDYFSADGQLWGNPVYYWPAHERSDFEWWLDRLRAQLALYDLLRIDHFRGLEAFWSVPADAPTARTGEWVEAPGQALLARASAEFGGLPVVAEDLGVITPAVEKLRDDHRLPGMRILQFGFDADAAHAFLPHNYVANSCAYTGTHDNDTFLGWWRTAPAHEREFAAVYLNCDEAGAAWAAINAVSRSVAGLAVFPLQDVLGLDGSHRMNTPGREQCWTWRFGWEMVGSEPGRRLARLSAATGRAPLALLNAAAAS